MAREANPLKLRPVDDDPLSPVIRLGDQESVDIDDDEEPIRLGGDFLENETSQRLVLPPHSGFVLRTHEPGIEAIVDTETPAPETLETVWGQDYIRKEPAPWGWFALAGAILAGALIWSMTRVKESDKKANEIRTHTENSIVDEREQDREAGRLIDRIDKTLREFYDTNSIDSLLRMVRQPERVGPIIRKYYKDNQPFSSRLRSIKLLQPLTLDKRGNFWMAAVNLADGSTQNLLIEIDGHNQPRIDWETLVCYQPMKWDDFATQRPVGSPMDFRVYVEQDNFFSHEFSDAVHWACFRLTTLNSEETVFGYAAADSAVAAELKGLLDKNGVQKASLILRLMVPEGLQSRRGVVIEKVVNNRWLYVDPPGSGS